MMKCNCNCISFILHINTCLYIHNTIDITLYYDRTYGGGRSSEPVAVSTVTVRTYINCISTVIGYICLIILLVFIHM